MTDLTLQARNLMAHIDSMIGLVYQQTSSRPSYILLGREESRLLKWYMYRPGQRLDGPHPVTQFISKESIASYTLNGIPVLEINTRSFVDVVVSFSNVDLYKERLP